MHISQINAHSWINAIFNQKVEPIISINANVILLLSSIKLMIITIFFRGINDMIKDILNSTYPQLN